MTNATNALLLFGRYSSIAIAISYSCVALHINLSLYSVYEFYLKIVMINCYLFRSIIENAVFLVRDASHRPLPTHNICLAFLTRRKIAFESRAMGLVNWTKTKKKNFFLAKPCFDAKTQNFNAFFPRSFCVFPFRSHCNLLRSPIFFCRGLLSVHFFQ